MPRMSHHGRLPPYPADRRQPKLVRRARADSGLEYGGSGHSGLQLIIDSNHPRFTAN